MRGLIALIVVVLVLALVGWISFSMDADRASVNLEKSEIKEDTEELLEAGDRAFDRARETVQDDEGDVEVEDEVEPDDVDVDLDTSSPEATPAEVRVEGDR